MNYELDSLIEDTLLASNGEGSLPLHTAYELVTKAYKQSTNARVQLLAKALRDCMEWMESTRASGDAGFWDWSENSEYTKAERALKEAGITQEKAG